MKRILCVIDSLGSGGAQRQMTELAKSLHEANYDVEVIYYVHYDNDHFLEDELTANNVKHQYVSELRKHSSRLFKIRQIISKRKPDVVISYYPGISKTLCIDHLFHHKSYKLIVSERSLTRNVSNGIRLKYQLYRFADYVVPNSIAESCFIKDNFSFLENKVFAINNVVDTEKFYPGKRKTGDFSDVNAIFVGRFTEAKNIPSLLKAIALVANKGHRIHVDFYGRDILQHCDSLIKELDIDEYVTIHAQTYDIEKEYRKHNLFIMASLWEGFPNVLCEAICCGLPALGSRVSDVPYLIEDGKNGYIFNPNDINDISEKIIKYLTLSDEDRYEMGLYSEFLSRNKFSKDVFLEKYIKLF